MQVLHIIVWIMSIVSYAAMTFLAAYTVTRLRRHEREIAGLKASVERTLAIVMAGHIRDSFNDLKEMQEDLRDLIDDDRFEEAERLKGFIEKAERHAFRELERFRKSFGDDSVQMTDVIRI